MPALDRRRKSFTDRAVIDAGGGCYRPPTRGVLFGGPYAIIEGGPLGDRAGC